MELKAATKKTELGLFPNDWDVVRLSQLASPRPNAIVGGPFGSDQTSSDYTDSGIPVIRGQNMAGPLISGDFVYVSAEKARALEANIARPGDIVFTQRGTLGQVSIVPSGSSDKFLVSQSQMKITPNSQRVVSKFFFYYFSSEFGQRQILESAIQTGVPHTNLGIMKSYLLPLPIKLSEQEAISGTLSDADASIELLKKLIAKKHLIRKALLQKLFTPNKFWKPLRLGDCASLKARIGWQGLTTAEYLDSGDYGLVTGTDFNNGKIDWDNCHYVTKDRFDQDRNIQLKLNDVLVTKDGTIGKVALISLLPQPTTLNSGVFVVRPINKAFDEKCFYYLLSSFHFDEFLAQLAAGSTISHLYQKDFINFRFKLPSLEDQKEIGSILFDVDKDIELYEKKLKKSRLLKQGMMQKLLTGRIRLV